MGGHNSELITLSVNLDGGSIETDYSGSYATGHTIELEAIPAKDNYTFTGWTCSDLLALSGSTLTIGNSDLILTANWTPKYLVTVELNGGSIEVNYNGYYDSGDILNLVNPTKNQYAFAGWTCSDPLALSGNILTIGNENLTITANWLDRMNIYVSSSGNDTTGNGTINFPYATINKAYQKIYNNGTIKLLSDITQTSEANFNTTSKSVTLTSNSDTYKIIRGSQLTSGSIILLSNSNTLTTRNITFDGNNVQATKSLLFVTGSSALIINNGTTITKSKNSGNGGGIAVNSSTLTLNGGEITNNTSSNDGGGIVIVSSTLTINDGAISNNTSTSGGGAIHSSNSSIININGGTISNNTTADGGGINATETTITLNNGTISGNYASHSGGGIILWSGSVNFKGGSIINNRCESSWGGGGGIRRAGGSYSKTGGTLSGNSPQDYVG